MAMSTPVPTKQLVDLLRHNRIENLWIDYDEEADVLYVNFDRPAAADDSEMNYEDTIVRYRQGRLVGYTILRASQER